jgi:hypothetical protein
VLQERHYVVKISALLDRSTAGAADDLLQTYNRASKAAGRHLSDEQRRARQAAAEHERAVKHVAGVKDRYFRDEQRREESAARKAERETAQKAKREEVAAERTAKAKARAEEQAQNYVARIRDRYFRDEQRRQEREERVTGRERRAMVKQIAGDAIANAAAMGRKALGVAGEITSGLGVDFSLQRGVAKGVELEKLAVAIVNSGNRGKGSAAQRDQDVTDLQSTARQIGNKYAFDPTQVLQGLAKYQALTGDLDTAKAGLSDLARLASAFNVDLDKMVAAAGQVGSAIGEVGEGKDFATADEKAKAILDVLKSLTAQGQEGAIEIADLARQMAGLKAAGGAFAGSTAENIKKVGALAQLSLQLGGSKSAAQATTAVMGFVSTLKTPARRREFATAGVDIEDKATGMFLDPFEIIKRSLTATKGNNEAMKKLFANVVGERAVTALTNTYKKAGGGDKGLAAVDEQFKRFGGSITDAQMDENSNRWLGTKAARAQITQNDIDARWAELSNKLLPTFEKLAPAAMKVVDSFSSVAVWSANNPGAAITAAIVGSIGKAAIGPMIGKALETSLGQKVGGSIAVGVASFVITKAVIEAFSAEVGRGETKRLEHESMLENARTSGALALAGKKDAVSALADQQAALMATEGRVKGVEDLDSVGTGDLLALLGPLGSILGETTGARSYLNALNPFSDQTVAGVSEARSDQDNVGALKGEIASLKASMEAVKTQLASGIKVNGTVSVDNLPPGGAAPAAGRPGIPDP